MKLLSSLFEPRVIFLVWCFLQLENLGNFIKAILNYGLKPSDIFEANDLFENGNMTQVQTTLLALASMVSGHKVQRVSEFWGHFLVLLLLDTNPKSSPFISVRSLSGKDQRHGHKGWYWSEICRQTSTTLWWREDQGRAVCHWTTGNICKKTLSLRSPHINTVASF